MSDIGEVEVVVNFLDVVQASWSVGELVDASFLEVGHNFVTILRAKTGRTGCWSCGLPGMIEGWGGW